VKPEISELPVITSHRLFPLFTRAKADAKVIKKIESLRINRVSL